MSPVSGHPFPLTERGCRKETANTLLLAMLFFPIPCTNCSPEPSPHTVLHAREGMDPDLLLILRPPGLQGLNLQLLCWLSSFQLCSVAPLLWAHWLVVKESLLPPVPYLARTGSHSRNGKGDSSAGRERQANTIWDAAGTAHGWLQ